MSSISINEEVVEDGVEGVDKWGRGWVMGDLDAGPWGQSC